jgi:RimJ/RimL family protein N-acetyltransferase
VQDTVEFSAIRISADTGAMIRSDRLTLRNWRNSDRDTFAALNADPRVMQDLGGPLDRRKSDAKFDRYVTAFGQRGFCRWALENSSGQFLGYTGVMPSRPGHPLGPHADIGWRLVYSAWGRGYAIEAARASLRDVFERVKLKEVLAYTSADNVRSLAVIARLNMQREAALDYSEPLGAGMWHGLVWVARPSTTRDPVVLTPASS